MEKKEVKALLVRKFQGFCDNGIRAMAILLIFILHVLDRGNFYGFLLFCRTTLKI